MTLKYQHLTDAEKANMLDARLQQYEAEHYQHTVNLQVLMAQPKGQRDSAAIEQVQGAIDTIEHAHTQVMKERRQYPSAEELAEKAQAAREALEADDDDSEEEPTPIRRARGARKSK